MKKVFSVFAFLLAIVAAFAAIPTETFNHALSGAVSFALVPAIIDTSNARSAYERVLALASKWDFIVAPGDIRSEQTITNTTGTYQFEVRDTILQGQNKVLQKGVQDNDLFVCFKQAIFMDNRADASTSSNVVLNSYPSYATFNSVTTTFSHLWTFYNGLFSIQVGSTQFINQYSSAGFLTVPRTQKSLATNADQFSLDEGLKDLGSYSIFSGKADNTIKLDIKPVASFGAAASSGANVLTFWARGFVVRNGANAFEDFRSVLAPKSK